MSTYANYLARIENHKESGCKEQEDISILPRFMDDKEIDEIIYNDIVDILSKKIVPGTELVKKDILDAYHGLRNPLEYQLTCPTDGSDMVDLDSDDDGIGYCWNICSISNGQIENMFYSGQCIDTFRYKTVTFVL
jgi:hypothetical protein